MSSPPSKPAATTRGDAGKWRLPLPRVPVGGRISHFKVKWSSLSSSKFVQRCTSGLPLELSDKPPQGPWKASYDSARGLPPSKLLALQSEIEALLAKRAIVRSTKSSGFYARVFLVPKKGGMFRPVFNLKPLNAHVVKRSFKMATVKSVANAIRPGDFAVSLDLKDAYLHVPILPAHRRYLKFIFKGQTFHFTVLPFGLSSAPGLLPN